jgi:hypothetical protein
MIYDHYYHGENRVKGISDTAIRMDKGACHLCSNNDSEQHYVLECMGSPHDTDILTPLRDKAQYAVTSLINTLKPGLTKDISERYRDLAFRYPPLNRRGSGKAFSLHHSYTPSKDVVWAQCKM